MGIVNQKKGLEIHLYREDGRDVWCNQETDGFFYDKKGNRFENLRPTLYKDMDGEYLHASI